MLFDANVSKSVLKIHCEARKTNVLLPLSRLVDRKRCSARVSSARARRKKSWPAKLLWNTKSQGETMAQRYETSLPKATRVAFEPSSYCSTSDCSFWFSRSSRSITSRASEARSPNKNGLTEILHACHGARNPLKS